MAQEKPVRLWLPALPLDVSYSPNPVEVSYDGSEDPLFTIRYQNKGRPTLREVDVYKARTEFLSVEAKEDAVAFLLRYGGFRRVHSDDPADELRWSSFRDWQRAIRKVLLAGPFPSHAWEYEGIDNYLWVDYMTSDDAIHRYITSSESMIPVYPQIMVGTQSGESVAPGERRYLRAELILRSTLEALLATVYLDGLNGLEHRLCSLPDCNSLYEVISKHDRAYCSNACAHKASVRRRRAEAKAVIKKASTRVKAKAKQAKKKGAK